VPVRPPPTVHLHCTLCTETPFNSAGWTEAWNHQLDTHPEVAVTWTLVE
jgi:hypothetical protein